MPTCERWNTRIDEALDVYTRCITNSTVMKTKLLPLLADWNAPISYIGHYGTMVDFHFDEKCTSAQASQALRDFVRATGIKLKKSYNQGSRKFIATGMWQVPGTEKGNTVTFTFRNFIPEGCKLVEKTRVVPACEEHTETYFETDCGHREESWEATEEVVPATSSVAQPTTEETDVQF